MNVSQMIKSFFPNIPNVNVQKDKLLSYSSSLFEEKIKEKYKIIEVDWLDFALVKYKMYTDEYFQKSYEKEDMVNKMLDYYLNHEDKPIYKKTDYLCNEKEGVCICNVNADAFRKIYDRNNYVPDQKYISYFSDNCKN